MATRTSVADGLWSAAGTWDTGVPQDGDVVNVGHTVTFDVDQTSMPNGVAAVTVTSGGVLSWDTTAGTTRILKTSSRVIVNSGGTLRIGTTVTPIAKTSIANITGGSTGLLHLLYTANGATICLNGWHHPLTMSQLAAEAALGATSVVVSDDLDLRVGDEVVITASTYLPSSEVTSMVYVVQSWDAGTKTITLTSGLLSARTANSWVVPISRSITLNRVALNATSTTIDLQNANIEKLCGFRLCAQAANRAALGTVPYNAVLEWATIDARVGVAGGMSYSGYGTWYDVTFDHCTWIRGTNHGSGEYRSIYTDCVHVLTPGVTLSRDATLYRSTVFQANFALSGIGTVAVDCAAIGCVGACISGESQFVARNLHAHPLPGWPNTAVIFSNSSGVVYNSEFTKLGSGYFLGSLFLGVNVWMRLVNCTHDLAAEVYNRSYLYNSGTSRRGYMDSLDHQQSAGAFRSWSAGGVVSSVTDVTPDGKDRSFLLVCDNASCHGFMQTMVPVQPGETLRVRCHIRKSASMTWLPRVQIADEVFDPLNMLSDTPLGEGIMTDSVDTWEMVSCSWTNSTTRAVDVFVRCLGMDSSGNVWFYPEWGLGHVGRGWHGWS